MPWAGKKGTTLVDDFVVINSAGALVTGLEQGDFTVELWNPSGSDVSGSITVTITELGTGNYRTSFTPNALGSWTLVVKQATYFPAGKRASYQIFDSLFDDLDAGIDAVPTAAEIDTQLSGTHGGGGWQGSTPAEIDTQLSGTHGSGTWEDKAGPGEGANVVNITVEDDVTHIPVPSVQVQIRNSDESVLLATQETDVNGVAGFLLDDGNYKVRLRKLGAYTFTNPQPLVVDGDPTNQTYQGTAFSPSAAPTPETCVVFGTTHDTGENPLSVEVVADLVEPQKFTSGGVQVIKHARAVSSASHNGYWEIVLTRSGEYTATAVKYSFRVNGIAMGEYVVPDQTSAAFADLDENQP